MTTVRNGIYPIINENRFKNNNNRRQLRQANTTNQSNNNFDQTLDLIFDEILDDGYDGSISTDKELYLDDNYEITKYITNVKLQQQQHRRRTRNNVLKDTTKIRKFTPGTGFLHKTAIPLWTSIQAINQQLKQFANQTNRVYYFDSTAVFVKRSKHKNKLLLRNEHISASGHPTIDGFKMWEFGIVAFVQTILKEVNDETSTTGAASMHNQISFSQDVLSKFDINLQNEDILAEQIEDIYNPNSAINDDNVR